MIAALLALLLAHSDAAWIQANPRYRDAAGVHCCGPSDCAAAPPGSVSRIADGWKVNATGRVFRDGDPDLYPSTDHQFWLCNRAGSDRCLFVPGADT